jgi:hypothetical protein
LNVNRLRIFMRGYVFAGALALLVAACSPAPQSSAPPASETSAEAPAGGSAPPAAEDPGTQVADLEPGAGAPDGAPMAPGSSVPPSYETPSAVHTPPPPEASGQNAPPPLPEDGTATDGQGTPVEPIPHPAAPPAPPPPPAAPAALPPAAANGHGPSAMPPAAANGHGPKATPPLRNGHSGSKVLSYFQKNRTKIDTARAFGFVLMPKAAVTAEDKRVQKDFCTTMLATMDFMTPSAVAASAPVEVLATYWPVVGSRESYEIKQAFTERNCDDLIAWYDFALARTLATQAGVTGMSGPLLITWPSQGADGNTARDPLIVDFSKANNERAAKALQYWFRQVKARPDLWTNRIREGTIRAELADAVNDTAGVLLTVMSGKWDSLMVVASAEP